MAVVMMDLNVEEIRLVKVGSVPACIKRNGHGKPMLFGNLPSRPFIAEIDFNDGRTEKIVVNVGGAQMWVGPKKEAA